MFSIGTIPDPRTALDQTPAVPTHWQRDRLAQALYYTSKHYTEYEGSFPATFDQLDGGQCQRYFVLGDYLLARRARFGAQVKVAAFEHRLFACLDNVLREHPYHLIEEGQRTLSEPRIVEWLLDFYALSPERAADLASRWATRTRPTLVGGEIDAMPY